MTFDPGQLRERVRFTARGTTSDDAGNVQTGFDPTTAIDRSALFIMRPGSEAVITARLAGLQPVAVVVRRDSATLAITAAWQMQDLVTGQLYAIVAPPADLDRTRQWLTIDCVAGKVA